MVSDILGRLYHLSVDNGDAKFPNSEFPVEFKSESFMDLDTTQIKSIENDEIYHLLELSHSEHDEDILDVDLQMLQT